jgi:hypothetical protein
MKLVAAITLDGLVRALRWNAHDLAEAVEGGYVSRPPEFAKEKPARQAPRPTREQDDDRTRR